MHLTLRIIYAVGMATTSPLAPFLLFQGALAHVMGQEKEPEVPENS